jgi:hypothetical protein
MTFPEKELTKMRGPTDRGSKPIHSEYISNFYCSPNPNGDANRGGMGRWGGGRSMQKAWEKSYKSSNNSTTKSYGKRHEKAREDNIKKLQNKWGMWVRTTLPACFLFILWVRKYLPPHLCSDFC